MNRIVLEDARDFLDYRRGSGPTWEIFDVQVGSKRREGCGRRLVQNLVETIAESDPDARLIFAITRTSNLIAQQWYENLGFRVVAVLRRFYRDEHDDCADAVMFGMDLPLTPKTATALQGGRE